MDKEVYAIVKNEKEGEGKSDVEFWKDEMENEPYDVWGKGKIDIRMEGKTIEKTR